MAERDDAVGRVVEALLRRAGEPVLEALAARGRLHVAVERDLPARDPEPFEPRFWRTA
jgi:hypothetical protein